MNNLNMSEYVVGPSDQPEMFSLYAVSNHYGTMHGGHYTAFCRNVYNRRWYKFDDQFVTEMVPREVVVCGVMETPGFVLQVLGWADFFSQMAQT